METYSVKLEKSGRILIPAEIRRQLGLVPGEDVLLSADDEGVVVRGNRVAAVRRLQEKYAFLASGPSLADELTAERRAAAEEGRVSKEYLLDSSALLTLILKEKRGEILLERGENEPPIIDRAAIHTVHIAEVVKKLVDRGENEDAALDWVQVLDLEILTDFNLHEALGTGPLCPKQLKLSLGDRIRSRGSPGA